MSMNHQNLLSLVTSRQFNVGGRLKPSLREIARKIKVPASTFSRLRIGKSMNAEAFIRIAMWLEHQGYSFSHIMDQVTASKPRRKSA